MATATRTRAKKTAPTIVYYRHLTGGAVHGYDKAFLDAAFESLSLPPELKRLQKKKHPLEEIAIQIHRGYLTPCAAPRKVNTVEVDQDLIDEVLERERELAAERKLAALEDAKARLMAGEDVDITALTSDSPYMPAQPAMVVPDPVDPEPRMPLGILDAEAGMVPVEQLLEASLPTDVVSPDRPMAAEPAGDTTPRRAPRRSSSKE